METSPQLTAAQTSVDVFPGNFSKSNAIFQQRKGKK
jgi:hypothetical protein